MSVIRKIFNWSLVLLTVIAGLYICTLFFGIWAAHETGNRIDIGYGTSTSDRLVTLEIGDRIFKIPQNHIWAREKWKGGKFAGVNMYALLPDFEPYTDANMNEFDKPGWNRKISFLLREHNTPESPTTKTSMTRKEVYSRTISPPENFDRIGMTDVDTPFGLIPKGKSKNSDDDLYVGAKNDGSFFLVECSPDGKHPHPSCRTYLDYSERVVIKYTFSKKYLKDWHRIDNNVLHFIHQFDVGTGPGD